MVPLKTGRLVEIEDGVEDSGGEKMEGDLDGVKSETNP